MAFVVDLLGGSAKTLTGAAPSTTAVDIPDLNGALRWAIHLNYEGLAGDGAGVDTFHPVLQTTFDGGTVWRDCASTASMNGGVVAAVNEFYHSLTSPAAARMASSDGALAASTVGFPALGHKVRLKGVITDADSDAQWRVNKALLFIYD